MKKKLKRELCKIKSLKEFIKFTNIQAESDLVNLLILGYIIQDALELEAFDLVK